MAVAALAATASFAALAQVKQSEPSPAALLETYETNWVGITDDSDDVRFLDVQFSLKYPILPETLSHYVPRSRIYVAATVRFAQYLGTRDSSPVIGKRFNPKAIWRLVTTPDADGKTRNACSKTGPGGCGYIDFAFAHESNGQSIDSPELFHVAAREAEITDEHPEFARDQISRGWDYFEIAGRRFFGASGRWRIDASAKRFLPHGPLQGDAEEYFEWENDPEGKHRRQVHGLSLLTSYFGGSWRVSLGYETGYSHAFQYHTVRVEGSKTIAELRIMAFYQDGYANDLALYYKRASSVGLALELATF